MSGHSKWATIKRKKGAIDAKRSKIFARIVKEISISIKEGGSADIDFNPRLRTAVANAKGVNMPKDNIDRAIKKAGSDSASYMEVTFEGTGPGGAGIFVECLTDNNQRTVSNIRAIFNKRGGTLGKNGSLSYLFDRKGVFTIKNTGINFDDIELDLIDAGLDDIEHEGDETVLTVSYENFGNMQKKLDELKIEPQNAVLERIANTTRELATDVAIKALKLVEFLEEDDDVQNVFHDIEMTDDLENALNAEE